MSGSAQAKDGCSGNVAGAVSRAGVRQRAGAGRTGWRYGPE
jgi:hypothetical protein